MINSSGFIILLLITYIQFVLTHRQQNSEKKNQHILVGTHSKSDICTRNVNSYVYEPKDNFYFADEQDQATNDQYSHYKNAFINWGEEKNYRTVKKLGAGAFSVVFLGQNDDTNAPVILKFLIAQKKSKIRREVKIQNSLLGSNQIQQIIDAFKTSDPEYPYCLVYNYIGEYNLRSSIPQLNSMEIKYYMYNILNGLAFSHSKGIAHLDLKNANIVINQRTHELNIIDWGLSDFMSLHKEYKRKGTINYMPPEMLLGFKCYDFTVDVWSAGCVFGSMMFRSYHSIFKGQSDAEILQSIVRLYGHEKMDNLIDKYQLKVPEELIPTLETIRNENKPIDDIQQFFTNKENKNFITEDGIDLFQKMLTFDFAERMSPQQLLQHRYFDSVRDKTPDQLFQQEEEQSLEELSSEDEFAFSDLSFLCHHNYDLCASKSSDE